MCLRAWVSVGGGGEKVCVVCGLGFVAMCMLEMGGGLGVWEYGNQLKL